MTGPTADVVGLVAKARGIASRAHAGQHDKANRPYIEHVTRVAQAVADDPIAVVVALLHDVEEDAPLYAREIAAFPAPVRKAVRLLTRRTDVPPGTYYAAIRANPLALRVKLADIADNASEERLALLDSTTAQRLREKYEIALKALGGSR